MDKWKGEIFLQDGKIPFSWLLPLLGETILVLGETILVLGETMWAKLTITNSAKC